MLRNKLAGNFQPGQETEPIGSEQFNIELADNMGYRLIPGFKLMGNWYAPIMGLFLCAAMIAAFLGLVKRMHHEIKYYGCTPGLVFTLFNGVWAASRMPIDYIKAGLVGVHDNVLKADLIALNDPVQKQVIDMANRIHQLQEELTTTRARSPNSQRKEHHHRSNDDNNDSDDDPSPPPSYSSRHNPANEQVQILNQSVTYSNRLGDVMQATSRPDSPTSNIQRDVNQLPRDYSRRSVSFAANKIANATAPPAQYNPNNMEDLSLPSLSDYPNL